MSYQLKSDIGLASGIHPLEDYPPVTMRAIEYILADELEQAFAQSVTSNIEQVYCNKLKANGILSKSWYCVQVDSKYH